MANRLSSRLTFGFCALFFAACPNDLSVQPCQAHTCADLGAACGTADDGCGNQLDCGACSGVEVCVQDARPGTCCTPQCDDRCGGSDGCGGDCPDNCEGYETCGGGGVENQCGCVHQQANETCAEQLAECGTLESVDNCGTDVHLYCGTCSDGLSCGATWANTCGERTCDPSGWCWVNPTPQGQDLRSIYGVASNLVWAVGAAGTVLQWDGESWRALDAGLEGSFYGRTVSDVWGLAADDVWIVGPFGIRHWDGTEWSQVGPESEAGYPISMDAVWGFTKHDVWAIGDDTAYHWNGLTWRRYFVGFMISDLWGSTPDNLWAVGDRRIAHFNGLSWQQVHFDAGEHFSDVWGFGTDDVWVLQLGSNKKSMLHWNGEEWLPHQDGGVFGTDLWGVSSNDMWAAGGGIAMHFDGSTWTSTKLPMPTGTWGGMEIWGAAADDVWAVGPGGVMFHWNGSRWRAYSSGSGELHSHIWGVNADDVWIVGGAPWWREGDRYVRAAALHWDGQSLNPVVADSDVSPHFERVWGAGQDDIWLAADRDISSEATVAHHNGSTWTYTEFNDEGLVELWGSGTSDVWLAFRSGLYHWTGSTWETEALPLLDASITGLWGAAKNDVWLATGGDLARFDGDRWELQIEPDAYIVGVWGIDAANVWAHAVGEAATTELWRWNGAEWQQEKVLVDPFGVRIWVQAIAGNRPDNVWFIVGNTEWSQTYHWNGTDLEPIDTPFENLWMRGLWMDSNGCLWVVGASGAVLYRD